jgi:hypothetical protein
LDGDKGEVAQPWWASELFSEKAHKEAQGLTIGPWGGSIAGLLLRVEEELFDDQLEEQLWRPSWSVLLAPITRSLCA